MPTSEFDLIYRYFSSLGAGPAVDLSVGDDCAILRLEPNERLATSVDTIEQAVERSGTKAGNKGEEAAMSALEMVSLLGKLD